MSSTREPLLSDAEKAYVNAVYEDVTNERAKVDEDGVAGEIFEMTGIFTEWYALVNSLQVAALDEDGIVRTAVYRKEEFDTAFKVKDKGRKGSRKTEKEKEEPGKEVLICPYDRVIYRDTNGVYRVSGPLKEVRHNPEP